MRYIHEVNFRKLDFRLLELFQAIRQCKSVSDAALLLEIPQPTASRGLARLREALSDELFVRTATGMEPTMRGIEAGEIIEEILRLANQLETETKPFEPGSADREFVIAGSDVGQWVVMTPFYQKAQRYPGIRLRTISVPGSDLARVLENGDVDLALGPYPSLLGNIKEQTLYAEHYHCICRPGHPFAQEPTVENFLASDHIVAIGRATAHAHRETEVLLRKILAPHRIRMIGESYFVALATLIETDLILTTPARGLGHIPERLGLVSIPPPIELPGFSVKQYWHMRNDEDEGHKWLRGLIRESLPQCFHG